MNALVKTVLITITIVATLSLITTIAINPYTTQINNAFIYFLGFINQLSGVVHVATLFTLIKLMFNFVVGLALFYTVWTIYHIFT